MWPESESLTLLTDLYELTMAYGYWKSGMADRQAVFNLFYRTVPFDGEFVVAAGLKNAVDFLKTFHFSDSDIAYLGTLKNPAGGPLFEEQFLSYLSELRFECDVDAMVEGRYVLPHEPLVRVRGPILQAQLLETAILNLVNFSSLIATKAARVRRAARDDQVMEFGVRRAQGPDGGLTASRAAYLGGCDSVSNVIAGKTYGIPVAGTHAHSWVMAFDSEAESFETWAEVMPDNCVLLLDTYDTEVGIERAIAVGLGMEKQGKRLIGVRLDSGDLLSLSKLCREKLDAAGLTYVKIVASNELDERVIADLKAKGSPIEVWGVGTRLATGHPAGALDGVYKLSAIQNKAGKWVYKAKRSDQPEKTSPPGALQVRRTFDDAGKPAGDVIYDVLSEHEPEIEGEDLLIPIFRAGKCVYHPPHIEESRKLALAQLPHFPREYPVTTEKWLRDTQLAMVGEKWSWDKIDYIT